MSFEPENFGKYYLVDKIATGGMAEIFKAKTYGHGGFENLLVIKRILSHLGEDPGFVEMFIDEAKVTVALQHRNVVRIYDFGKIASNYFIAMEYLDGKDTRRILRKLAQTKRYLPVEYAVYITSEACKGLDYAHTSADLQGRPYGIVHRDMSPSNLMVAYSGEVKVADFGIAKASINLSDTDAGVLKGKYQYMSPEQASGSDIDHRSDIFSLGVVLWEMLTGRRLFKGANDVETLEWVRLANVQAPSSVNGRVPRSLDAVVLKALAGNPEDRYASARALYDDLVEFLFPSSTDQLADDLSVFMRDLFADEIAQERERLESGSEIAARLHEASPSPDAWGETPSVTLQPDGSTWRLIAVVAVGMLALVGVFGGGAALLLAWSPDPVKPAGPVVPAVATLDVMVDPPASVWLDGTMVSDGVVEGQAFDQLAPGIYAVRLEAAGYETFEDRVVLEPGGTVRLWRTLEPVVADPEPSGHAVPRRHVDPVPEPSDGSADPVGAGTLTVAVVGAGWAHVYVDDVALSVTAPLSGAPLSAGAHVVRVENADLGISHTQSIDVVAGETVTVQVRPL